eukprot:TRINITY_DN25326_c0_g1_i1.p1 TRINITY_DN25326_c0_g1~~TRINITY_DN25326_c0_g1_i1.p1  ORF type:complete len:749 (-),score=272.80 TRINITY_DN25326_c0_g1_i1:108-2354(-)
MAVASRLLLLGAVAAPLARCGRIDEDDAWPVDRALNAPAEELGRPKPHDAEKKSNWLDQALPLTPPEENRDKDASTDLGQDSDTADMTYGEAALAGWRSKTAKVDHALAAWRKRRIEVPVGIEATAAAANMAGHMADQVEGESKGYGQKADFAMQKAEKLTNQAEAAKSEFFRQRDDARQAEKKATEAEAEAHKQKCVMEQRARELEAAKAAEEKERQAAKQADEKAVTESLDAESCKKSADKEASKLECKQVVAGATAPFDGMLQPEVDPVRGTEARHDVHKGEIIKMRGLFCPKALPPAEDVSTLKHQQQQFDGVEDRLDAIDSATTFDDPNPDAALGDKSLAEVDAKDGAGVVQSDAIHREAQEAISDIRSAWEPGEPHLPPQGGTGSEDSSSSSSISSSERQPKDQEDKLPPPALVQETPQPLRKQDRTPSLVDETPQPSDPQPLSPAASGDDNEPVAVRIHRMAEATIQGMQADFRRVYGRPPRSHHDEDFRSQGDAASSDPSKVAPEAPTARSLADVTEVRHDEAKHDAAALMAEGRADLAAKKGRREKKQTSSADSDDSVHSDDSAAAGAGASAAVEDRIEENAKKAIAQMRGDLTTFATTAPTEAAVDPATSSREYSNGLDGEDPDKAKRDEARGWTAKAVMDDAAKPMETTSEKVAVDTSKSELLAKAAGSAAGFQAATEGKSTEESAQAAASAALARGASREAAAETAASAARQAAVLRGEPGEKAATAAKQGILAGS